MSKSNRRYFSLVRSGSTAELDIYGDITSWPWLESDVSAYNLSQQLAQLDDVTEIHVNINSYGGEVAEGLAIYNALMRHPARVTTRCDGFACSIASVIFMAGDERVMNQASLLMIHNAWTYASGDANELRKQADDLDTITGASKAAYMGRVSITEDELAAMMDEETFITPDDAVSMGFATAIEGEEPENVSQSARRAVFMRLTDEDEDEDGAENGDEPGEDQGDDPDDAATDDDPADSPGDDDPEAAEDPGEAGEKDPDDEEDDEESDDKDAGGAKASAASALAAFLKKTL